MPIGGHRSSQGHAAHRRGGPGRLAILAIAAPVLLLGGGALSADAAVTAGAALPSCNGRAATLVVSTLSPATVSGTSGRDVIVITGGRHTIWAGAGNDIVCGSGLGDIVHGGSGDDRIYGRGGADRLYGGLGNDRMFGSFGRDVLRGGLGNDYLSGGNGVDILDGSVGDDSLIFDGTDILLGLEDDETYAPPG
jgi:Ca2+-binding RTX toxin-like protein